MASNEISAVSAALREIFSELIAERTGNFTGREWVFAAVDAWLQNPAAGRFFLLCGDPGTGKSAIAARLAQMHLGEVPAVKPGRIGPGFLAAYHFCRTGFETTLSSQDF